MKKSEDRKAAVPGANGSPSRTLKHGEKNGSIAVTDPADVDLDVILAQLQAVRDGNFSVRLPGSWIGLPGKIADTFNEIVAANQHMADDLEPVGQRGGKEGRTRVRAC